MLNTAAQLVALLERWQCEATKKGHSLLSDLFLVAGAGLEPTTFGL